VTLLDASQVVTPSSQAMVVGIPAEALLAVIGFLLAVMGGWIILMIRDHKAKTEAELAKKVDRETFTRFEKNLDEKFEMVLQSNRKQIEGPREFMEWDRRREHLSRYPGRDTR
jgi:hypothetical protein